MFIYNQHHILPSRICEAELLLRKIPCKYAFITGSFLYKEAYGDIDIFAVTRKKIHGVESIDFNQTSSVLYHSLIQCCVAKAPLPRKKVSLPLAKFWDAINEAVPEHLNSNTKQTRLFIIMYEYLMHNKILDSYELHHYNADIPNMVHDSMPLFNAMKPSYRKRFFYTKAGELRKPFEYEAQKFLYTLACRIAHAKL